MNKILSLFLSFLLVFSLCIPVSASELDYGISILDENLETTDESSHGSLRVEWVYEDVTYHFKRFRGNLNYTDIPLYISSNASGIVFQFDANDTTSGSGFGISKKGSNGALVDFALDEFTDGDKHYYQAIIPYNVTHYGLPFSSLSAFRSACIYSTLSVYYLESPSDPFSSAVNFATVDLGDGSGSGDSGNTGSGNTGSGNSGGSFTDEEKSTLFNWLHLIYSAIGTGFDSLSANIASYFSDLGNYLGDKLDSLYNLFYEENEDGTTGRNFFDMISDVVDSISTTVSEIASSITTAVTDITSSISTAVTDIVRDITAAIDSVVQTIADTFTNVILSIENFILNFYDKIYESFKELLTFLFIPSDGYFDNLLGDVNGRYEENTRLNTSEILQTVKSFAKRLNNFIQQDFSNVSAPTITVNLSNAEGKYNYGVGNVNVIDFSWFARYRHYTDPFFSAMLWIGFIWLLVKRLPDILSAVGMTTEGGIYAMESMYTAREQTRAGRQREADKERRASEREADKKYKKSYEYYKENRFRKEMYSARYNYEMHGRGRGY